MTEATKNIKEIIDQNPLKHKRQIGMSLAKSLSSAHVGLQVIKDHKTYTMELCPACDGERQVGGSNTPRVACPVCFKTEGGHPLGIVLVPTFNKKVRVRR